MQPERRRGREKEPGETGRRFAASGREEKDRQDCEREQGVRARLGGIEVDEGIAGAEGDPPGPRRARRQRPRRREEREGRREGNQAQEEIAARGAVCPSERPLERIEERRPGIRSQRIDHAGRGQARGPLREELVVPERALDEEPDSGEERDGDDRGECDDRRTRPALRYGLDALF